METAHEIVVRPTEVDVNGHVNNAKYVEYMEWGARGVIRAPEASPRPAVGARGRDRDRDRESEVKGGRKSMLDDPLPARTASRQTSGRTGSAGHRPSTLSSFGNQAVRFHRVRPGPRCTVHRGLEDVHGRAEGKLLCIRLSHSGGWVPASVGPELAADRRVADHEVNRVRNFGGIDQPLELRVGEDVLLDVLLPQRPDHRSVGEARVNDGAADSVVNGLLTQGSRSAFEGGLGGGVGDLAGDARRRDRADEDDRPLDPFRGL